MPPIERNCSEKDYTDSAARALRLRAGLAFALVLAVSGSALLQARAPTLSAGAMQGPPITVPRKLRHVRRRRRRSGAWLRQEHAADVSFASAAPPRRAGPNNKRVPIYETNVVDEVLTYLEQQANSAVAAGISPGRVILDPGIGFGKLPEHNLAILASLDRLVTLGFPTLLGTSHKSTIGNLTGKPIDGREFGTAATIALAASAKIDIVRVHDVGAMKDVLSVADAIERGWRPAGWNEQTPRTSSCAFCAHATQGLS